MKAGIFVAAALVQIAAAQPHRHNHANLHEKKQVYVTDVSYATVTAAGPNVVVYVNAAGEPVTTSTIGGQAAPTSAAPPPPAVTTSAAPPPPATTSTEAPPPASTTSAAAPYVPPPSSSSSDDSSDNSAPANNIGTGSTSQASSNKGSTSPSKGTGIVYSAYTASGECKTQDQVNTDFEQVSTWGYDLVRIYGTDCDQVNTVGTAARAAGMKLFAGVFSLGDLQSELQTIIDASKGDFSYIDTISIGNELVNQGAASADQVVAAVNQARGIMNAAGYTGKIVTVDTFNAILANPSLCQVSDYAAMNAHPFFDATILPAAAGTWALATKASVAAVCDGKDVLITETGMPWGGDCNGLMCPSYANQATVLDALKTSFPSGGYIVLSAYNDLWKQNNAWTFDAEQNWGTHGDAPSA